MRGGEGGRGGEPQTTVLECLLEDPPLALPTSCERAGGKRRSGEEGKRRGGEGGKRRGGEGGKRRGGEGWGGGGRGGVGRGGREE